jgi:hypothetical protein
MKMNMLDTAVALTDRDLLARLPLLAAHERSATAELVAHLAALRLRPSLYAAQGYGSLFAYCRSALRFSEDAASNRIHAARACLKFPMILDLLASGELSLSAVRMLRPHLTTENHEPVLGRARNARRADIERLVAELAPRPDVPSSVRRLALTRTAGSQHMVVGPTSPSEFGQPSPPAPPAVLMGASGGSITTEKQSDPIGIDAPIRPEPAEPVPPHPATPCSSRPIVQPLSPERYRVQFTIGQDTHDILRRLQTLLRREIPDGDAGAIFERALRLLHEEVAAAKFGRPTKGGAADRRRPETPDPPRGGSGRRLIRDLVDPARNAPPLVRSAATTSAASARSRHTPKAVKRAVWYRDRGQCAFVSVSGRRCAEQEFLELHHIRPYALKGPATAANIALRCRRHNVYEAEVVFGARAMPPPRPERTS